MINFRDRYLWQGLLLILISVTGLIFPEFVQYLFILGGIVGVVGVVYSVLKQRGIAK